MRHHGSQSARSESSSSLDMHLLAGVEDVGVAVGAAGVAGATWGWPGRRRCGTCTCTTATQGGTQVSTIVAHTR